MNGNQNDNTPLSFWQDTRDCWRRLPNKGFFFLLLAAWLALFQFLGNSILGYIHTSSLFSWMHEAYRSSSASANDDAHGNFIPFLVVWLFWWKRRELLASSFNIWWPGLLILAAGMALHILGYDVQQPHLSILALFLGIYGLMGLAWGREWLRKSVFPFCLFIFSVPLGARSEFITFPLRQLVSWMVTEVAHWILGIDVIRVGTQLYDASGTYQYEVAAACSGMRSLIAIFLLATIYGFITFRSLWKRLLLMALAFPLAVLGNLTRMLFIIMAAELNGQEAGNYVHESSLFSLVPYVPAIIGLMLAGRLMEKWWGPDASTEQRHP
ncbi:MAG: exosortase/archaeosortase family protein [Verrucomicrobiia bacterium]|jgi:exosortase